MKRKKASLPNLRQDRLHEMTIRPDLVSEAIVGVGYGFVWDETREGYSYWRLVSDRLKDIRDKGVN